MPRKIFPILLILYFVSLILHSPVSAITSTPTPNQTTCDLCGRCGPDPTPPPSNWQKCQDCLYPTPGVRNPNNYYTVLGCISTEPGIFVKNILEIVLSIAGGVAFLGFLAGASTVLTSSGNPEQLQRGKDAIISSILGVLLIIFSVFILRAIGLDILKIPGFGG